MDSLLLFKEKKVMNSRLLLSQLTDASGKKITGNLIGETFLPRLARWRDLFNW